MTSIVVACVVSMSALLGVCGTKPPGGVGWVTRVDGGSPLLVGSSWLLERWFGAANGVTIVEAAVTVPTFAVLPGDCCAWVGFAKNCC